MNNDYTSLENLLNASPMGEYADYVREDLIDFAMLAIEEAIHCVDIPMAERNTIRLMMGMYASVESSRPRDIGLVTTTDWTK